MYSRAEAKSEGKTSKALPGLDFSYVCYYVTLSCYEKNDMIKTFPDF